MALIHKQYSGSGSDVVANTNGVSWCVLIEVVSGSCAVTYGDTSTSLNSSTQFGISVISPEKPFSITYDGEVNIYADFDAIA